MSSSTATWWQGGYKRHDHLSLKNLFNAFLFLAAPLPSLLITLELYSTCLGENHRLDTSRQYLYNEMTRVLFSIQISITFQFSLPSHSIQYDVQHSFAMGPVHHRQCPLLPQRVRRVLGCGSFTAKLLADRPLLEHHSSADCPLLPPARVFGSDGLRARRPHADHCVDLEHSTHAQLLPSRGVEVWREGRLALLQDGHG